MAGWRAAGLESWLLLSGSESEPAPARPPNQYRPVEAARRTAAGGRRSGFGTGKLALAPRAPHPDLCVESNVQQWFAAPFPIHRKVGMWHKLAAKTELLGRNAVALLLVWGAQMRVGFALYKPQVSTQAWLGSVLG